MSLFFIAGLALIAAAMAGLALGMERHFRQWRGVPPRPGQLRRWRAGGWLLLALSPIPWLLGWGIPIGIVLWSGWLAAGVVAVAGCLTRLRQ